MTVSPDISEQFQAKSIVLNTLSATYAPVSVKALIRAGEVLGVDARAIRVALTRLKAQELVQSEQRGIWALGTAARATKEHVHSWRTLNLRMRAWEQGWIGVHLGGLARERKALRLRSRALRFMGFAEFSSDLFIRPDNLLGGVEHVRERLYELELDTQAPVFRLGGFSPTDHEHALHLWDHLELNAKYNQCIDIISQANAQIDALPEEDVSTAARLVYERGGEIIHILAYDPVLPAPLVDVHARAQCIEEMTLFDQRAKSLWRHILLEEVL